MACCTCDESGIDLANRDPYDVNSHIKVKYDQVIAEPNQFRSCDFLWDSTSCCYECWFMIVYQVLAVCCSCCLTVAWGCEFAHLLFLHVWYIVPWMKSFEYCLHPFKCCYSFCVHFFIDPWFESCSYCFGAFEKPGRDDAFKTRLF